MRVPGRSLLLLLLLGPAAGCVEEEPAADPALRQLVHWIAFQPRGGGLFFLHRFELREVDCWAVLPDKRPADGSGFERDLPASRLSLPEAERVAAQYLGRLPTAREWSFAVGGEQGFKYPWGDRAGNPLYANTLELGIGHPTRVGTFESGRDPTRPSCYDLIGNVSEWTTTPIALHPLARGDIAGVLEEDRRQLEDSRLRAAAMLGLDVAGPFLVELLSPRERGQIRVVTLGFSHAERLDRWRSPWNGRYFDAEVIWDERGTRPRFPSEWSSTLGLRLATDPYTFLARLEAHGRIPTEGDLRRLEEFLDQHHREFRRAARLRARLDRDFLGLPEPGALARHAWTHLGVEG